MDNVGRAVNNTPLSHDNVNGVTDLLGRSGDMAGGNKLVRYCEHRMVIGGSTCAGVVNNWGKENHNHKFSTP